MHNHVRLNWRRVDVEGPWEATITQGGEYTSFYGYDTRGEREMDRLERKMFGNKTERSLFSLQKRRMGSVPINLYQPLSKLLRSRQLEKSKMKRI